MSFIKEIVALAGLRALDGDPLTRATRQNKNVKNKYKFETRPKNEARGERKKFYSASLPL